MRKSIRVGGVFLAATLFVLASLTSCGGGGGGGDSSPPTNPIIVTGVATGTVVDGPISGATVQVFDFTGNQLGRLLGSGTTDPTGSYTITLTPPPSGPVKIFASGGTYTDDATGALVTLTANDQYFEIVSASSITNGQVTGHVNPLNSIAANLVVQTANNLGLDNAILQAKGALGQQ